MRDDDHYQKRSYERLYRARKIFSPSFTRPTIHAAAFTIEASALLSTRAAGCAVAFLIDSADSRFTPGKEVDRQRSRDASITIALV